MSVKSVVFKVGGVSLEGGD